MSGGTQNGSDHLGSNNDVPFELAPLPKVDKSDIDPELDKKLDQLKERAIAARSTYETHSKSAEKAIGESGSSSSSYRGLGYGLSIAYTIIGAPAAGFIAGKLIDQATGNTDKPFWTSWLTIIMSGFGLWLVVVKSNRQNELDDAEAKSVRAKRENSNGETPKRP